MSYVYYQLSTPKTNTINLQRRCVLAKLVCPHWCMFVCVTLESISTWSELIVVIRIMSDTVFFPGKIFPNLLQQRCANFWPGLFYALPKFCLKEFQPFVNVVVMLWGNGRRRVWRECVAAVAITYISMCGTFPLAENLTVCNGHVYLLFAINGSDDERGPAGFGSSVFRLGKTVM